MHICVNNTPAKLHPDPIRNDGAHRLFWRDHPNKNKKQEKEQDEQRVEPIAATHSFQAVG